jgi:DHA1 family multidrug resistance protein B-like MFS transporter
MIHSERWYVMSFLSFSKTIRIRLFLQFLTLLGTMSVMPYIVVFFSARLGTFITGFMFLGVISASILGSMVGGYLADRKGRKAVIVWSELIVFLGFSGVAIVNSPWLNEPYITFVLFVLTFLFSGMAGPAYQALIIDESSPSNRKVVYTYSYWLNNLAIAIGGVIGAFLFKNHQFLLFSGVTVIMFTSLIITIVFIKDRYLVKKREDIPVVKRSLLNSVFHVYKEVIHNKGFAALAFANLLILSVEEQLTNFIGIRLTSEITDPVKFVSFLSFKVDGLNLLGILKAENTIIVVFMTVIVSYMLKKLKDRSVILGGIALYFIGYIVISFHNVPIVLVFAMFIATIGELMHIPIKQTLLANMIPEHARGTYLAVYGLMSAGGTIIAGLFIFLSGVIPVYILTVTIFIAGIVTLVIFSSLTKEEDIVDSLSTSN